MSRAAAGAAAVLCFGGATALHAVQDRWPKPSIDRPELLYVRSPAAARRAFIGSQAMAADLYWIRAIQHFGQERLSPPTHARTYALLFPLLDLTTTIQTPSAPYTYLITRIEAGQKRDVPVNNFSSRDGTSLNLRLIRPRSVRAAAKDLTGKSYESQTAWK